MKNVKQISMLFVVAAMTMCCVLRSDGQTAQVVERLADGSLIIAVDGTRYRALTADQLRKVQEAKINLEAAAEENRVLREQISAYRDVADLWKKDRDIVAKQLDAAIERGDEYKKLFADERALRLQAEKLPAKKSKLERIINHPVVQVAIVAASTVIAARSAR